MAHQQRKLKIRAVVVGIVICGAILLSLCACLTGFSRSSQSLFLEACEDVNSGRFAQAESLGRILEGRSDGRQLARVIGGGVLVKLGDSVRALQELPPELASGPARPFVLMWAGEALYQTGSYGRAVEVLKSLLGEKPEHAAARRLLAAAYFDLGAMNPALAELETLKQLEPDDFRPWNLSGVIYLDFEQYKLAVSQFDGAMLRIPARADATEIQWSLARALYGSLDSRRCREVLEALPLTPARGGLKALCSINLGELAAARKFVDESLRQPDADRDFWLAKAEAQVCFVERDYPAALIAFQRCGALKPEDSEVWYSIARTLKLLGREDDYATALERAESVKALRIRLSELSDVANSSPHDAGIRVQLAEVCRQLGMQALADDWERSARACRFELPESATLPADVLNGRLRSE